MNRTLVSLVLLLPVLAYGQGTTIGALPLRGSPQGTDLVWCQVPTISDNSCTLASILGIHEAAYDHVALITPYAETLLGAVDAAAARTVLGLGSLATLSSIPDSTYIDAGAIDYDRIQAVTPLRLLGRSGTGGPPEELSIGANCSIVGTEFNCAGGGAVDSVFGRSGDVVAAIGDYTWAQIDKTASDIADITTRAHASLTGVGTNTHAQIDTHIADTANPHNTVIEGKDEGVQQLPAIASINCTGTAVTCSSQPGNELQIDVTAGSGGGDVVLSGTPSIGELTIWATPPAVTGDPELYFDTTAKLLTVGPQAGSVEAPSQLGSLELTREAGHSLAVISAAGVGNLPGIAGLFSRGTYTAKTATQTDDALLLLGGRGHNGTSYDTGSSTAISFRAQETQTATNEGSYILFETTADGATTRAERLRLNELGLFLNTGDLIFDEKLDYNCTISAGKGCLFLDDSDPTTLVFIDDAGGRTTLGAGGAGGGDVFLSPTPASGEVAVWINNNTIEGRLDISLDQYVQNIRTAVVDPATPWTPTYLGEGLIPVTGLTNDLAVNAPTGTIPAGRVWLTFKITASGGTRTITFPGYTIRGNPAVTSWDIADGDTEEFQVHTDNEGTTWYLIGEDDTVAGGADNTPWGAAWSGQTTTSASQNALHGVLSGMDADYDNLVDGLDIGAVDNANEVTDGILPLTKFGNILQYTLLGREVAGTGGINDFGVADLTEELSPAAGMFILGWNATGVLVKMDVGNLPGGGGGVTSFNTRTGAVVPATNDYTWAQIDKTASDIADITTRAHSSLTGAGTNTHAQIDTHIADTANPHNTVIEGKDEGVQQLPAIASINCTGAAVTCSSQAGNELQINVTAGGGDVSVSGTPSADQLAVWTSPTAIEGEPLLQYDTTADRLYVGDNAGTLAYGDFGVFEVSRESADNLLSISVVGGAGDVPGINTLHARGTYGAETATQADDIIYFMGGRGHTGSSYGSASQAAIRFAAQQTHTATDNGTYITIETTPNGSTTRAENVRINEDGVFVTDGDIRFDEKADHNFTPTAGDGYLWVKNTAPNTLIYTNDTGTDTTLGVTAASVGSVSDNLDDTDASVEWEDATALDLNGALVAGAVSGGSGGDIVDNSIDANDIDETSNYVFTGTIGGLLSITEDTAATVDLSSASNAVNALRVNSDDDAIAYTLPPVAAGLNVCFHDNSASGQVVTINPDSASNGVTLDGTDIALGTAIASSGTRGEFICLVGFNSTRWVSMGISGDWN